MVIDTGRGVADAHDGPATARSLPTKPPVDEMVRDVDDGRWVDRAGGPCRLGIDRQWRHAPLGHAATVDGSITGLVADIGKSVTVVGRCWESEDDDVPVEAAVGFGRGGGDVNTATRDPRLGPHH